MDCSSKATHLDPNATQIWVRKGPCPAQKTDFGVRFAQTDKMCHPAVDGPSLQAKVHSDLLL